MTPVYTKQRVTVSNKQQPSEPIKLLVYTIRYVKGNGVDETIESQFGWVEGANSCNFVVYFQRTWSIPSLLVTSQPDRISFSFPWTTSCNLNYVIDWVRVLVVCTCLSIGGLVECIVVLFVSVRPPLGVGVGGTDTKGRFLFSRLFNSFDVCIADISSWIILISFRSNVSFEIRIVQPVMLCTISHCQLSNLSVPIVLAG